MRHHRGEAAVRRGHGGEAGRAAVRVGRVAFGGAAVVVHKAHGRHGLCRVAALAEVGKTFAMRHHNGQAAAGHAGQKQAGRVQHLDHGEARFKALALVGGEARPSLRAGDDVGQLGEHLAAVAHAQAKAVGPGEKGLELRQQHRVEGDAARPAYAGSQRVAVAEAAAGHQALEIAQIRPALLQIGHVHVEGLEAGFGEGVGHFHMRVHALLAQDGDLGPCQVQERRGRVLRRVERERHMRARVVLRAGGRVFGVGTGRVVALLANLPAHAVPDLMQVLQRGAEHRLGVTPDLNLALAHVQCRMGRTGLADEMAVARQAVGAQRLHHGVTLGGAHLQHHAQFLAEQRLQRQFLAPGADLLRPVLAVAVVGTAVADAVTFSNQQIHVQRHAHMAGKSHFAHGGEQAAVAAVVVGQDLAVGAQRVHGVDQAHQQLRVVQVGHAVTHLVQGLRQNAAAHAVAALAQVDQHQGAVGFLGVELRRQRAAHVGQRGKGADDQADR